MLDILTETLKPIIAKIEELEKRIKTLEQEGSYFTRVENIKEIQNLK